MRHFLLVISQNDRLANQIQLLLGGEYNVRVVDKRQRAVEVALREKPVACIADSSLESINPYEICGTLKSEYNLHSLAFMLIVEDKSSVDQKRAKTVGIDFSFVLTEDIDVLRKAVMKLIDLGLANQRSNAGESTRLEVDQRAEGPVTKIDFELAEENSEENPFLSSEAQYADIEPTHFDATHGIEATGSDSKEESAIFHIISNQGGGESDEAGDDDIPNIASPHIDMMLEAQELGLTDQQPEEEIVEEEKKYVDPVSEFLDDPKPAVDEEEEEIGFAEPETNSFTLTDPSSVGAMVDIEIKRAIAKKLAGFTEERIEQLVADAVDKKMTRALAKLSGRIQQVINKAVQSELEKHLGPEIDKALKNK